MKKQIGLSLFLVFSLNAVWAQFRVLKPHSVDEDFLISSDLSNINSFRFYPQSKGNVQRYAGLNESELPQFADFKSNFNWFYWNNPEYFGNKRLNLTSYNWLKSYGLFQNPNRFISWQSANRESYLVFNPVIDFNYGPKTNFSDTCLTNGKGLEMFAQFGKKLALHTRLMDYQSDYSQAIDRYKDSNRVYPGIGKFYRNFAGFVDYFYTTGYISATLLEQNDTDSSDYRISAMFGHDKQFVGNGYRSLILSDFAPPTLFLQINYSIGPFKYQNLFKELVGDLSVDSNFILNRKYLALHRGSYEFRKIGLELGASEMIIQSRKDNGLDVNYLNPIIFYRAIERDLGSGDNALIALDAKLTRKKFNVYTQILLDEFSVKKAFTTNYYTNKFGFQLGTYIRPEMEKFNGYFQLEFNQVRPFTYSHWTSSYYSSYNQALAHPLESNLREFIGRVFLQPKSNSGISSRWTYRGIVIFAEKGYDMNGKNYGSNMRKNYYSAVNKNDAPILQGNLGQMLSIFNEFSYYILPNWSVALNHLYRNEWGAYPLKSNYISVSMKFNFTDQRNQYLF